MILFAADISQLEQAREYIRKNGFTADQVAIKRKGDDIIVITKDGLNPWTGHRHKTTREIEESNKL